MKTKSLKYSLIKKITLLVILAIVLSQAIQIISFELFLKKNYNDRYTLKMNNTIKLIQQDIQRTQSKLTQGVKFVNTEEDLLASIYFINNYQDKLNYNAILLDEEKKRIVENLLNKVKLSQNDSIELYDKNNELISFVNKTDKGYIVNFTAYDNGKVIIYSKNESEEEYKVLKHTDNISQTLKHTIYSKDETIPNSALIQYHIENNNLIVRSHKTIHSDSKFIGHIELSKIYNKKYFEKLSQQTELNIIGNSQNSKDQTKIELLKTIKVIDIVQNDNILYLNTFINCVNGTFNIDFSINTNMLDTNINQNRMTFLFTGIISLILILSIAIFILRRTFNNPISNLMKQIEKIENNDYTQSDIIHTNDELESISNNINYLSKTINQRESKIIQKTKEQDVLLSLFNQGESVLFKWNNDEQWSVDYVSVNVKDLLGYSEDEFINNKVKYMKSIHKEDLKTVIKEVNEASNTNQQYFKHAHYRVVTKDGTIKWIMDYTVILRDENNNITHYLGYITDITTEKEKDNLLSEQSKMVALGEMIGNIAHQWRQPLSVISTGSTGMKMQKEFNSLSDEQFNKTCDLINDNAQYLSKTIDDFRNFIIGDREKVIFNLEDNIDSFLHLVEGSIKSNNINMIFNLTEDIEINGFQNELIQCIINIFNNAKDILVENKIEKRFIFISTEIQNNMAILTIKDNAGGIPEDVLPKIFEPYFTTKHKSQGTGLGLHMSYKLITEGMNGSLEAHNETYTYEDIEYTGALFTIELPLS